MTRTIAPGTNWFEENPSYEGEGVLYMSKPGATLTGKGFVTCGSDGRYQCAMWVEKAVGISDKEFLVQSLALAGAAGFTNSNPFERLEVECPAGHLTLPAPHLARSSLSFMATPEGGSEGDGGAEAAEPLLLHVHEMEYTENNAGQAAYWVAPLWNFRTMFKPFPGWLPDHPLRFIKRGPPQPGLDERRKEIFEIIENGRCLLVPFAMDSCPAYIEPLPAYKERVRELDEENLPHALTAVMVGGVASHLSNSDDFLKAFPMVLFPLLSLGTGVQTVPAYFEWRAADGTLVKRLHAGFPTPYFRKGEETIYDGGALGRLVTSALESAAVREWRDDIAMAAQCAYRSQLEPIHLEDSFSLLYRAFEALLKVKNICTERLDKGLSQEIADKIKATLAKSSDQIRDLLESATLTNPTERETLRTVAGRVQRTPLEKENKFGLKFIRLLDSLQLPDATIAERHFNKKMGGNDISWADWINFLRNAVVHDRGIDFSTGEYSCQEIINTLHHLHDILVRILLKMVGYQGLYSPTVIRARAAEPLDWPNERNLPALVWKDKP